MLLPAIIILNVVVGFFEVRYIFAYRKTHPSPPKKKAREPIQAWKFARITSIYTFSPLITGDAGYGPEASYVCTKRPAPVQALHESLQYTPHPTKLPKLCSCGFYAYRKMAKALQERFAQGLALLRVELYGTVHEGAFGGYRAEKQRVLCVYLFCATCDAPATKWLSYAGYCDTCLPYTTGIMSLPELAGKLKTEVLPATKEMIALVHSRY